MSTNENDGLGELRADVRHIQSDITDIKADLRITNQRIEALDQKFDHKIESLRKETGEKIDKLDHKIESVRIDVAEVKESLGSAKVWALVLYIGLAGSLFYVLAHGFKWI